MEHKIGTRITIEVVEGEQEESCKGCFFDDGIVCRRPSSWICASYRRTDVKHIIYKEVKD